MEALARGIADEQLLFAVLSVLLGAELDATV
jgi:hypothetical protein